MWMAPLEVMGGSARSGTPWDRMHEVHSSSSWVGLPLGRVVVDTKDFASLLPRLATRGELEPPHPAAAAAANAANTATPPARQYCLVISCLLWVAHQEDLYNN